MKSELKTIFGEKLHFDWKIVTITIISTLVLMVGYYHKITPFVEIERTILYLVVPLFFIIIVFRESPREYGFTLGNWRAGLILTISGIMLMTPIIWYLAKLDPSTESYYKGMTANLPCITFLDLLGWEFLFRGWILFGYARKFGPEALWLQAVPFALAHIGKPEVETLSTIFGGFAFGWVAWRTKSFVYPLLIHWFVASFTILVAAGVLG